MNDPAIENEVIRRWQAQTPMRRIATELRISRYRVKRILLDHQTGRAQGTLHPDLPAPPTSRSSILDPHLPFIQDLLARWPSMTAQRIHEELRARGFVGGQTIVKELVRRLRPEPRRQPVLRFETGPGVQAQMDWSVYEIDFAEEGRRRVNLFSYVLGYSRRQYLHFTESQDFETTLREHVRAFTHLGGVAATCLYDNMKIVVARYEGDEPIYNTRFLAFATHYGYKVWACSSATVRASRTSRWKLGDNTPRSQGARSARPRCRSQCSIRPNPLNKPPNCRRTRFPAALKRGSQAGKPSICACRKARRGSCRMNSTCDRLEQATIRSTTAWTSAAVKCSRRVAATTSAWLPAGNRVNCRAIVGDNSPKRRSSRHSSESRSNNVSRRQTQLLCRWSNSAT
jgi:transposase